MRLLSQKTIVEIIRALRAYRGKLEFKETLYERNFPHWFVIHAESQYGWDWQRILIDLRSGTFFYSSYSMGSENITGEYLNDQGITVLGESLIQGLAAFATMLPTGTNVKSSLQLDGFEVNPKNLTLLPLEGPVTTKDEEDALTLLVKRSGIQNHAVICKHIEDAHALFVQSKDHPSLNESRSLLQALVDEISFATNTHGGHSVALPGGTGNRLEYLQKVGFLTGDEELAFRSGWGSLSAGSHPGVPEHEQARIGLVLALEFSQILLLKFETWRKHNYCGFS